jgi:hypothetical protein
VIGSHAAAFDFGGRLFKGRVASSPLDGGPEARAPGRMTIHRQLPTSTGAPAMSMAMERQIERMQRCPDVAMRLRRRPDETGRQEERLDQLLDRFNETCSMLKAMAMQFTAKQDALTHAMADDGILKNTFANLAFEPFAIASYKSAIAMAEAGGCSEAARTAQMPVRCRMAADRVPSSR